MPSVLFAEKYGALSATGVAKETTFGTPVAATNFVPAATNTMAQDPSLFYPELMQGIIDKQVYPLYGEEKDIGAVSGPLFPTNGIPFLLAAIGTDVVTGSTAPYTHTFSQAVTPSSLTVEKNIGNFQSLQWAGTKVNKYSIKGQTGSNAAEFTADLIAQSVAILSTPTTISVVNESPFVSAEFTLTYNSQAIASATNFQLDIERDLKPTYTFNQSHALQFLTGVSLRVSGSFDVVFANLSSTQYDYFTQATSATAADSALSFALTHPASGGSITLTMPAVRLSKTNQDTKPASVVMETVNFEARYQLGGGSLYTIQAVVQDGQATAF